MVRYGNSSELSKGDIIEPREIISRYYIGLKSTHSSKYIEATFFVWDVYPIFESFS